MPILDKASPAQTRRPRADRAPKWLVRESARFERSRRIEAAIAALARVRAAHGRHEPSR